MTEHILSAEVPEDVAQIIIGKGESRVCLEVAQEVVVLEVREAKVKTLKLHAFLLLMQIKRTL